MGPWVGKMLCVHCIIMYLVLFFLLTKCKHNLPEKSLL